MDSSVQKHILRCEIKEARSALLPEYRSKASQLINQRFLDYLDQTSSHHSSVGLYWPILEEIDTKTSLESLHDKGIPVSLPKVIDHKMEFVKWTPKSVMEKHSSFKFLEPQGSEYINPSLIVAPLLTCDAHGNRLGYGKGFYDKYLANNNKVTVVGFCYKKLLKEEIPHENHDKKLDIIFTEEEMIHTS